MLLAPRSRTPNREISLPLGSQSKDTLKWTSDLRKGYNEEGLPEAIVDDSTPYQGVFTDSLQPTRSLSPTRSKSPTMLKQKSLRKSGSQKNLSTSLNGTYSSTRPATATATSAGMENIEAEYIKNLQQQIYFLELEANYLREQAKKATEMHPKMTAEAERMLAKLRSLQQEADGLQLDVRRKESNLDLMMKDKKSTEEKMAAMDASFSREKRVLLDEIVSLKRRIELLDLEVNRKEGQLAGARGEIDGGSKALKNAETQMAILRDQLEKEQMTGKSLSFALEDSKKETTLKDMMKKEAEDKLYTTQGNCSNLMDQVNQLTRQLKETEDLLSQEKYLKSKLQEEQTNLLGEKSNLNGQLYDTRQLLDRERGLKAEVEARQSATLTQLSQSGDKGKMLEMEVADLKKQLDLERYRIKDLESKLSDQENLTKSTELSLLTTKGRLNEQESNNSKLDDELNSLRRDKNLLVDHVSELQKKVDDRDTTILHLRQEISTLESNVRMRDLEISGFRDDQASKWNEFEKMAENLKSMSHTQSLVVRSSSPAPPSTGRLSARSTYE